VRSWSNFPRDLLDVGKPRENRFLVNAAPVGDRGEVEFSAEKVKALGIIRDLQVPRSEYDVRLAGVDRDRDNLQRQIDQVRTALGDTYSLRDLLRDTGTRLDRVEGKH